MIISYTKNKVKLTTPVDEHLFRIHKNFNFIQPRRELASAIEKIISTRIIQSFSRKRPSGRSQSRAGQNTRDNFHTRLKLHLPIKEPF